MKKEEKDYQLKVAYSDLLVVRRILLLPSVNRLKKNKEFKKVYQRGISIANQYLILYYLKSESNTYPRFGFSVSKRIGKAVERNRVKRRLREAVRKSLDLFEKPYDIIFIARPKIKGILFNDVEKYMIALVKRAQIAKIKG